MVKILTDTVSPGNCQTPEVIPEVHAISKDPLHYSIVSAAAVQKIRGLESMIAIDPGKNKVAAAQTGGPEFRTREPMQKFQHGNTYV